jgi:release factor glutamine methyltransferase
LGQFDLILCNPPYVEESAELAPSVREYEPAEALYAGPDGLDAYRVLIPKLSALLAPEGAAVFEIGPTQAEQVAQLADAERFSSELRRDLANRPRALILRLRLGKGPVSG